MMSLILTLVIASTPDTSACDVLRQEEGLRLEAYLDPVTKRSLIGYGHEGGPVTCTVAEAEAMLANDVAKVEAIVDKWFPEQPKQVKTVLICMVYQLGEGTTKKFKKFTAAIHARDYALAVREMKSSIWYKQTPKRVDRLVKLLVDF